jgi:hypothetical protein
MRDLNEFVQDCLRLKSSFEFFGHSIKKPPVANEDFLNVTLAEAGLAPSALINFRYTNASEQSSLHANKSLYIRDDLIHKHLKNL